MRSNLNNSVHVEGYVFSHSLQNRVSRKGVPFIMGDLNIATDDQGSNVVPVHFTYVTETYAKSGKPNQTYALLNSLIEDSSRTFESCGKDAMKVRVDGDVEVNDFVTREGEMASPKRIRGSFVHQMTNSIAENPATFDVDMLIAAATEREVEDGDDYMNLRGYVFNFRGDLLPVDFNIRSKGGMLYFGNQDISNSSPLFTHIKGNIVSATIETRKEEESAFGEPIVNVTTRNVRTWDVTWAAAEPYEFGDGGDMSKDELKQKLTERETYLAEVKKNHEDYMASRNGGQNFAPATTAVSSTDTTNGYDDDDFAF